MIDSSQVVDVRIEILRFVADDQPGWVECRLVDALGRVHLFVEKAPIVSEAPLDRDSSYPQPGAIAGVLLARHVDVDGSSSFVVDTERPHGVTSSEDVHRFTVRREQLLALALE